MAEVEAAGGNNMWAPAEAEGGKGGTETKKSEHSPYRVQGLRERLRSAFVWHTQHNCTLP